MSFVNPIFIACVLVTALVCINSISLIVPNNHAVGRYRAIDGLRGYLALCVFIHHASIWHFFLTTGKWQVPPSQLYTHLGETSVSLFFMITGFLFYGKILDSGRRSIDWKRFFVARLLRLFPLYLLTLVVMLVLTAIESKSGMVDSSGYVLRCIAQWIAFTIPGQPSINQVVVSKFNAGVNWSLPYEWFFYLCMPLIALTGKMHVSWKAKAFGAVALILMLASHLSLVRVMMFGGGIAAALLTRNTELHTFAKTRAASVLVLFSIASTILFFSTSYGTYQLLFLSIAFSLIAAGTDIFGMLDNKASHALGNLSYGIYLTHGLFLFVVLKYVVGDDLARHLSAYQYWSIVLAIIPVMLATTTVLFNTVEFPLMHSTGAVMHFFNKKRSVAKTSAHANSAANVADDRGTCNPVSDS